MVAPQHRHRTVPPNKVLGSAGEYMTLRVAAPCSLRHPAANWAAKETFRGDETSRDGYGAVSCCAAQGR
jgi:hypothetical protein